MHFEQAFKLDGQTAVITAAPPPIAPAVTPGPAAGLGRGVPDLFARQGATLVLLDRDAAVQQVAQRLSSGAGAQSVGLVCDVTCSDAIEAAVAQAVAGSGRLDILVNNAGVGLLAPGLGATEADWDKTMAINLKAPFLLARAAARVMQRQGRGRIVNLASQASVVALERHAAYCASKAALVAMGQVLAIEWAPYGITVNAVSPTVVETALGKQAWSGAVG